MKLNITPRCVSVSLKRRRGLKRRRTAGVPKIRGDVRADGILYLDGTPADPSRVLAVRSKGKTIYSK